MKMKKNNQKGFSLVELLVVVIIIAIIAAIAIPNLLASRRAANQASAASTLRTFHSAEVTYYATAGGNSQYGTPVQLLGQKLVDPTLGVVAPQKSGYNFAIGLTGATSAEYCAIATPITMSSTGDRIFGVGSDVNSAGVVYQSAIGGANPPTCTTGTFATGGSTPLG